MYGMYMTRNLFLSPDFHKFSCIIRVSEALQLVHVDFSALLFQLFIYFIPSFYQFCSAGVRSW